MLDPMAFFCPGGTHFGKHKKQANGHHKGGGMEKKQSLSSNNLLTLSPTGSDLSRKESFQRMVVIQEYLSKDRTGVTVRRGQTVELIGGDREWLYVKTDRGEEGYIPRSHCVYPYAAARPEREGEMDSRPQLDMRSRSFSNNQNDNTDMWKLRDTPPNGIAKSRVLSPALPSPQLQKNTNNTNNEVTGIPVSEPSHSPNSSNVLLLNGIRFSDHSSSSGNYEPSDYSSGDERTMSPDQSIGQPHDNGFISNALKNKMASESDLLSIRDLKDRPLPATPSKTKNPPHIHMYSLIDDFPPKDEVADNECPYSNPLDAIPANQSSWMDNKRWLGGSASDLLRHHSRQREATPEWKPPLPSRAPLQQGSTDIHRLSTSSNTGSQRSINGSTDGSCCTEHRNTTDNKAHKFRKFIWGVYVMQQDFDAVDENEISVRTGQHVSLLNQDDTDWYWVVRHDDSQEGFVPREFLIELMHVEQPYSAVTGKPLFSCIKQHTGDSRAYRSGSDAGSSIASDHVKFTRSHSGSPASKVPPGGNKRRHRNPINGLSTSPAPPNYSERDISVQGLVSAKTSEGIPMRKCESVPVRKDAASAITKSKSPECVNSSAQSESGESSIVGTLV